MEPLSTSDQEFLATIDRWIDQDGEFLWSSESSMAQVQNRLSSLTVQVHFVAELSNCKPADSVIVLRGTHLPLGGLVDDDLISRAKQMIVDGEDWLIVCLDQISMGKASWFHDCPGKT